MFAARLDRRGRKARLADFPTDPPKGLTREAAEERFRDLGKELFGLQDLLWGAKLNGVLVVLQGRDTAGKDGAIKHVVGHLNPRGVHVTSFGVPTPEEREHDFLWRVHRHAPRLGEFAIFNRSHYEDVLVVRVNGLAPKPVWKGRYEHIRDFEQLLAESGLLVLKFFLHISPEEQEQRLLEREVDPRAAWKLSAGDWRDREKWDDYTDAYEAVLEKTSTRHAPWYVVPANAKWFRNLAIAEAIVNALRPLAAGWQESLDARGAAGRLELESWRAEHGGPSKKALAKAKNEVEKDAGQKKRRAKKDAAKAGGGRA